MKRSENSCSLWSTRVISFFAMTSTVVGDMAVAVGMQMDWPATASVPVSLTTVSFMPPSRMYMTFVAGSPCTKTVSLARNLFTFLPRPAESRNNCTSKRAVLELALGGRRRTFPGTRLAAEDNIPQASMKRAHLSNSGQSVPHGATLGLPKNFPQRLAHLQC